MKVLYTAADLRGLAISARCRGGGQQGLSVAFDLATHAGYDRTIRVSSATPASRRCDRQRRGHEDPVRRYPAQGDLRVDDDERRGDPDPANLSLPAKSRVSCGGAVRHHPERHPERVHGPQHLIYPPEPSMRIVADIIAYTSREMPKFNSISISGYHMQEAGATWCRNWPSRWPTAANMSAPPSPGDRCRRLRRRLSFFFAIGMNFFMEAAKLRAARLCGRASWKSSAEEGLVSMFERIARRPASSLQEQDPGNIVRTAFEAMSAAWRHQSLHTNSFDEAIALPTEFSARIARNTQLIRSMRPA